MYYNSGCSHLLSAIVQRSTGKSLTEYAEEYLFEPLEIEKYTWHADAKGIVIGGFGLSISSKDMLKIGQIMLQNGYWNDQQVITEEWVKESTIPRFHTYDRIGSYGYHWWILTDKQNRPSVPSTYFAMGYGGQYGGQYIIIVPEHQLVITITSELYTDTFKPLQYFKEWCQAPSVDKYHDLSIQGGH